MPIIRWNILTILKFKKEGKKKMSIKIALAGNPNSGKTTLFNGLTGSNQFVGNWPGVTVEKKDVDTSKEYNEQEIVDQSVKAGTVLGKGDSITLYIPNILEGYPNMVEEEWTIDDVEAFCTKYNVTLKIDYKETSDYEEGTLISQSRSPKTPIVSGTTLKIVVAKKVEIVNDDPKPSNDPNSNTTETKSDTTTNSKES